jgi:TusA-related sulfurtransferase
MGTRVLDMRGRACPAPIVELMRAVRGMSDGDTIEVCADDRAFPADITAWCRKTQNVLIRIDSKDEIHVAVVRKGQVVA